MGENSNGGFNITAMLDVYSEPKNTQQYVGKIIGTVLNIGILIAPVIGYGIQGFKFRTQGTSYGYSLSLCFKVLLSLTLRIFFWIESQYNIVLFGQAIYVCIMQFFVIAMYLRFRSEKEKAKKQLKDPKNSVLKNNFILFMKEYMCYKRFWEWDNMLPYIIYYILYIGFLTVLCLIFGFYNKLMMNLFGLISAIIDAIMIIPQIILNYQLKNGDSLSVVLIFSFLLGDSVRLTYYFLTKCPWQFILCGFTQVFLNMILIFQIFYYHKGPNDFISVELLGIKSKQNQNKEDLEQISTDEEKSFLLSEEP